MIRVSLVLAYALASADPAADGLLIVAPREIAPALKEFVAFKSERLSSELVELETALQSPGGDDPERLKRCIFDRWERGRGKDGTPLGYVLLVGDADVMPVRYMALDRNTEAAFNYAFYPSDLYYADLARSDGTFDDWNAKKDAGTHHARYFGEVRGEHFKSDPINFDSVDYRPDIAVGRWPVSTAAEAVVVARKSMTYERGRASREGGRVGLVAVGGWIENRPLMDAVGSGLGSGWTAAKLYWDRPGLSPPDEPHVIEMIRGGTPLILHSGHGNDDRWDGSITISSIAGMDNADRLPIMMSAGCSTARLATLPPYEGYTDVDGVDHRGTNSGEVFTAPPPPPAPYQHGAYNPTGLGEQLLRAGPGGAAAYIGCNTGSQPCGMTLMQGFAESIATRAKLPGPVRVGDCWKDAVTFYYERERLADLKPTESWYPASIFFQGMKFMVYGDPMLPICTPRD